MLVTDKIVKFNKNLGLNQFVVRVSYLAQSVVIQPSMDFLLQKLAIIAVGLIGTSSVGLPISSIQ
jgi:hypothetical protein